MFHSYWAAVGPGGQPPPQHGAISVQARERRARAGGAGLGKCGSSRPRQLPTCACTLPHRTRLVPAGTTHPRKQDSAAAVLARIGELEPGGSGRFLDAASGAELPW